MHGAAASDRSLFRNALFRPLRMAGYLLLKLGKVRETTLDGESIVEVP